MQFNLAKVKGVKADVAKGSITLTFTVPYSDLYDAQLLAAYVEQDAGKVELSVTPMQQVMALLKKVGGDE